MRLSNERREVVVTDLDATLLDANYQWKEAAAVVARV